MRRVIFSLSCVLLVYVNTIAQTTAFTYQGSLKNAGAAANGNYDFIFALYAGPSGGSPLGEAIVVNGVAVTNGLFSVTLNFGDQFTGDPRYLEVNVRPAGSGPYVPLTPRQQMMSSPYAIRSLNATTAATATNALQLGGVAANQYVLTGDVRLSDSRNPLPGSSNYIQNQNAAPQASSNFNISGNGIVGGTLSVGNSGTSARVFLNRDSSINTNSSDINFITAGTPDFSLGTSQGSAAASDFSIYNYGTGSNALTIQKSNGNVGIGVTSTPYKFNVLSTTAGAFASHIQTQGVPTNSSYGLVISAGTSSSDVSFQARSQSGVSHLLVRGDGNVGLNMNPGSNRLAVNHTTPNAFATSIQTSGIPTASSYGLLVQAGTDSTDSALQINSQSGTPFLRVRGNGNVGIGTTDPQARLDVVGGDSNPGLRFRVRGASGGTDLFYLDNEGNMLVQGFVTLHRLLSPSTGGSALCMYSTTMGYCQSGSSIRFKTNIQTFTNGIDLIKRLRPASFDWTSDGTHDFGLVAEEVAAVEPLLATYKDGQIHGVKYDRIGVVLINAVKEQQAQIESQKAEAIKQQAQIESLKAQVEMLKKLVCASNPTAAVCKK